MGPLKPDRLAKLLLGGARRSVRGWRLLRARSRCVGAAAAATWGRLRAIGASVGNEDLNVGMRAHARVARLRCARFGGHDLPRSGRGLRTAAAGCDQCNRERLERHTRPAVCARQTMKPHYLTLDRDHTHSSIGSPDHPPDAAARGPSVLRRYSGTSRSRICMTRSSCRARACSSSSSIERASIA